MISVDDDGNGDDDNGETSLKRIEKMYRLEICNWLISSPDILQLANNMLEASNPTTIHSIPRENIENCYRLFDEELKCLFLRCRDPPRSALEQLVNRIFGLETYKKKAEKCVQDARVRSTDYRNKYNGSIVSLVEDFRMTNER